MGAEGTDSTRVGLVGLGAMGFHMGANIAGAGHPLTVHDARPEPVARLRERGAVAAADVAELAAASDVILVMVRDDAQVEAVLRGGGGGEGVLDAARPGSVVVVHSTVDPATCRALAQAATDRDVAFLDAPVSGGELGSRQGELVLMVGGDGAVVDRCRPLFASYASDVFPMGPVGSGQATKLLNNVIAL